MVRKLNTAGLVLIVVAGLAIGLAKPAMQAYKSPGCFGSREDRDTVSQPGPVNNHQISDRYSMTIDAAAKQQLGEQTFNEVSMFFQTVEVAIETKDIEVLMAQYSGKFRDGALDKKSVEQAWRRIFARVDTIATVNRMRLVNISADRNMVVFQSSGLLVGVPRGEKWPVAIDNWNKQDHVLVKERGKWKLIGTYGPKRKRLWFDKPMHTFI